ncbi:MAG: hypothetical protein KDB99_13220 [Chitinophagaceae bacterium]|nr:hypothetical protein [Chitinophagaceae bacterium]
MRKVVLTISMLTFVVAGINAQEEEKQDVFDLNKMGNPKVLSHSWEKNGDTVYVDLTQLPKLPDAAIPPDMVWNMPCLRPDMSQFNMPNVAKTEAYARIMRERYGNNKVLNNPVFKLQQMNKDTPGAKK